MSNFSFSHNIFKRLVLQTCKIQGLFGKGLNESCMMISVFDRVENNVGQGENAGNPFQNNVTSFENIVGKGINMLVSIIDRNHHLIHMYLSAASAFKLV